MATTVWRKLRKELRLVRGVTRVEILRLGDDDFQHTGWLIRGLVDRGTGPKYFTQEIYYKPLPRETRKVVRHIEAVMLSFIGE